MIGQTVCYSGTKEYLRCISDAGMFLFHADNEDVIINSPVT